MNLDAITHVVHVLANFGVAQEALEGENNVNLSLLPMIIHKLGRTLHDILDAVDDDDQVQFYKILFQIHHEFETRWGNEITYRVQTHPR